MNPAKKSEGIYDAFLNGQHVGSTEGSLESKRSGGFTLAEVLVALALGGLILSAAVSMLYSFGNAWLNTGDRDSFLQHAEGVSFFLESAIATSAYDGSDQNEAPIRWGNPPGDSAFADPLLRFHFSTPSVLFYPESGPITCYLHFDERSGLSLLWHPTRDPESEEDEEVRRTILSTYAQSVTYHYYDLEDERWEQSNDPLKDENEVFRMPDFIEITLQYENFTQTFGLALPANSYGFPTL